ncbi:MAG: glycoside hydrolase family 78 protein [Candidatus Omnitrophica bacterium]|nr:glycoside hydrolase family 78 protein [Candidatus Omnitrophota bacterium]MCM8776983.1 glycoside hydrolase family 78 protein [Candidatus Omnitrophota bacterium]
MRPLNLRCEGLFNPVGIDTEHPRLSWMVTDKEYGQKQTAYRIVVASSMEKLSRGDYDMWDTGKVKSEETLNIKYRGKKIKSRHRYYWQVEVWDRDGRPGEKSDKAFFETGFLKEDDWKANWIAGRQFSKSPLFRREFILSKKVKSARLYICGQGIYEIYINGCPVTDNVLHPVISYYSRRMYYDTYDITPFLKKGKNVIGVWLAPGWFGDPATWTEMKISVPLHRFPYPPHCLIAQIEVFYYDGEVETVSTDEYWKTEDSPLTPVPSYWKYCFGFSGETYDGTKEMTGWNTMGFDDSHWSKISYVHSPTDKLSVSMIEPNRIKNKVEPVNRVFVEKGKSNAELIEILNRYNTYNGGTTFSPDVWFFEEWQKTYRDCIERYGDNFKGGFIYDLGRHISGWIEIRVRGKKGDRVCLFGLDCHILSGKEEGEVIREHFIHRVVRYVPVFFFGYGNEKPEVLSIRGLDISSNVESAGSFSCSYEKLTEIANVIKRTIEVHLLSGMIMDSWQERFGTFTPGEATIYNWNVYQLARKLVTDFSDQQGYDGRFTMFGAPISLDYPALKESLVYLPYLTYLYYGDVDILKTSYPVIKRYTSLIIPRHNLRERTWRPLSYGRAESGYGDHGRPSARWYDPHTGDLYETMSMVGYFRVAEKIALIVGEKVDAEEYRKVQEKLVKKCNRQDFFNRKKGLYGDGDQGCHALALALDIVPDEFRKRVVEQFFRDIMENRKGHLNTGFGGTVYLLKTLIKLNRPDIARIILTNDTPPSIWSMLNHPQSPDRLTILPEFYTGGMIPHPGLSSTGFWFYQSLGGIIPDASKPGFKRFAIKPQIDHAIEWVKSEYNSVRGKISSQWENKNGRILIKITVPYNTSAIVYIPGKNSCLLEGKEGIREKRAFQNCTVFKVNGGTYYFNATLDIQRK